MAKEFRTVEDLIELMEDRNLATDENTAAAIRKESYYAIVNGYKKPFLDAKAMRSSDEDVFKRGTQFSWIYTLFLFDRDLRNVTFKYLAEAEAIMKTSLVYAFCEAHPDHDSYLQRTSYVDAKNMLVPKGYRGNILRKHQNDLSRLMSVLNSKIADSPTRKPYVSHYANNYGTVPLWVLANDLTFGNMSHFYQLQTRSIQNRTCKLVLEANGKLSDGGRMTPHELLRAFSVLTDFRNLCAHDDRLYCSKVGKSADIDYSGMAVEMLRILPKDRFSKFLEEIFSLFDRYGSNLHVVTRESLLRDMGFSAS